MRLSETNMSNKCADLKINQRIFCLFTRSCNRVIYSCAKTYFFTKKILLIIRTIFRDIGKYHSLTLSYEFCSPKIPITTFGHMDLHKFKKCVCFENCKVMRFLNHQLYSYRTIFGDIISIIVEKRSF